jgi:hypothetical protein
MERVKIIIEITPFSLLLSLLPRKFRGSKSRKGRQILSGHQKDGKKVPVSMESLRIG